ncbi:hypothetical protein BDQ17DRAFT_1245247 [Cyathus striatus]|nr:hypothetical protein BDQ17DRAFT_1245247 [Cyathus striatus]
MRGLAFPSNATFNRETSYEYGTPTSNIDDIPIDPALATVETDPAPTTGSETLRRAQVTPTFQPFTQPEEDAYERARQYSQAPQGDPFAPQPIAPYLDVVDEPPPPPPPKPTRRKRKITREEECSFCQGNDASNTNGEPEQMLTCNECGRSGWHMDCLDPPVQEAPEGKWCCPMCSIQPQEALLYIQSNGVPRFSHQPKTLTPALESPVASSSRLAPVTPKDKTQKKRKTYGSKSKGKPPVVNVTEESDVEEDVDLLDTPMTTRSRTRPKSTKKRKRHEHEAISMVPRTSKRKRAREVSPAAVLPRVRLRLTTTLKDKGKARADGEESPIGLFDDILGADDRDTKKTIIGVDDKTMFERSRIIAEQKLAPPPLPTANPATSDVEPPTPGPSRPLRSSTIQQSSTISITTPIDASLSPGPCTPGSLVKFEPGVLRIRTIRFGPYDIKTWYDAPFPEEYANIPDGRLWICEFCLKYMKSRFGAERHRLKCKARNPPGDEIYRDGSISIFEVDGRRNKIYCQNLCLLSKMFLDHKSLFYDVEPFLFYVITEVDEFGARFVGYFSKEKRSPKDYNVSCIMTLPVRQRQGWGNLLIDFSYLLSKMEQRVGSPEKPLSNLGALGYKKYWTLAIMRYLEAAPDHIRLEDISTATSMTIEDVCETLIQQNMIYIRELTPPAIRPSPGQSIKFPKGRKNGIARRQLQRMQTKDKDTDGSKGPFVPPKYYEIRFDRSKVRSYIETWEAKGYLKLKPEKLQWTPYLISRHTGNISSVETRQTPDPVSSRSRSTDQKALSAISVDSPAAALFDSDELPVVDARSSRPSRSRTKSPVKAAGNKNDTLAAQKKVVTDMSLDDFPRRRLRGHGSHPSDTPTPNHKGTGDFNLRSRQGKLTRMTSKLGDHADVDAALASKLAQEERRQGGRQLRARPSEIRIGSDKPNNSTSTPARKRRRIDLSSEISKIRSSDEDTLDEHKFSTEGGSSNDSRSTIYVNGEGASVIEKQADAPEDDRQQQEGNAMERSNPSPTSADIDANTGSLDGVVSGRNTEDGHNALVLDVDMVGEVKTEDIGTPLTSIASHHSVPSDDTIFATEIVQEKRVDVVERINEHAESDERLTLVTDVIGVEKDSAEDDEYGDADADGEYEEDAEGEPDPELLEGIAVEYIWKSGQHRQAVRAQRAVRFEMDSQVQNESTMQYGHIPMTERRDSNLDSNGSTHQSLGQALGNHLAGAVGPGPAYSRSDNYRHPSTSPPNISQPGSSSHATSPLFTVNAGQQASPAMKRKQIQDGVMQGTSVLKRRRDAEDGDGYDLDGGAQGAKHWTDEEKSKLFNWLMGPGQDDHWNALRATKNSCLRECAGEVFGSKKTYQALKGCYERNFNLFKQIYAFESFHSHPGTANMSSLPEADRVREYERRLQAARKAGCDVGNITARTIDHWHRMGWYELFYRRWHGDPATTRPVQPRGSGTGVSNPGGVDDPDIDDEQPIDFDPTASMANGINGLSHPTFTINPQTLRDVPPAPPVPVVTSSGPTPTSVTQPSSSSTSGDQPVVNLTITQNMLSAYMQFLQVQTQTSKMKLEYLRRREEREEKESTQRREMERLKMDREAAAYEHQKKSTETKQKADRAMELLSSPSADTAVKQAASDYLKRLFAEL